jgi:hypothetical protein
VIARCTAAGAQKALARKYGYTTGGFVEIVLDSSAATL